MPSQCKQQKGLHILCSQFVANNYILLQLYAVNSLTYLVRKLKNDVVFLLFVMGLTVSVSDYAYVSNKHTVHTPQ